MLKRYFSQLAYPEIIVLTLAALVTRLWQVTSPMAVVFDEVYFKAYAANYLTGTYYFDPHPPLGKLLLGGFAWLLQLSGPAMEAGDPATALRYLPALAGAMLIPLVYTLLRQLSAGRKIAALGAGLVLLDNALTVESRFILTDSLLLLFGLGALSLFLKARTCTGTLRVGWLGAAALVAGLAGSTKWTGLAALGLILVAWFTELPPLNKGWRQWLKEGLVLIITPVAIYLAVFSVHFSLLHRTGQGDAFMSSRFQATLIGNPSYDPSAKLSFVDKFIDLNRAMKDAEASLRSATHPYGSKWYTWPLLQRPIYYWQGSTDAQNHQGNIYLQGNPVIWWVSLLGVVAVAGRWLVSRRGYGQYSAAILFLIFGWAVNFLPFSQIHRVMFLYHYLFALIFSIMITVLILGIAAGWNVPRQSGEPGVRSFGAWFPSAASAYGYWTLWALAAIGFVYFAPLTYGWTLSPEALQHHVWLSSWR